MNSFQQSNINLIGLALAIPAILVGGPLLGYLAAIALMTKGAPPFILPLLVGAGSILAFVQTFRTVKIILELEKTRAADGAQAKEENHDREHA